MDSEAFVLPEDHSRIAQLLGSRHNLLRLFPGGVAVKASAAAGTVEFAAVSAVGHGGFQDFVNDRGGDLQAVPEV